MKGRDVERGGTWEARCRCSANNSLGDLWIVRVLRAFTLHSHSAKCYGALLRQLMIMRINVCSLNTVTPVAIITELSSSLQKESGSARHVAVAMI